MSYRRIALGPAPCASCGMPLVWVRTFDGLEVRGCRRDRLGRLYTHPHECRHVRGQTAAFPDEEE